MTPEQNLGNALIKKKAKIAEIKDALSRPTSGVDHFGRRWRADEGSRLRVREEQLHLEQAVAELEAALQKTATQPLVQQGFTPAPVSPQHQTKLERLRLECGLSFKELADETGTLDEKNVRGHCQGKGMRPKTRALYKKVFSRLLNQALTVADLTD